MKKNRTAFTLIELLITMMIIALMTAVVVPAFNKYGAKSVFSLQASEIQELILQANMMSRNPEQGVPRYIIKYNESDKTVKLFKTDEVNSNLIKAIKLSSDFKIKDMDAKPYLVCDSPKGNCCKADTIVACTDANRVNATGYFILQSTDDALPEKTFKLSSEPFRVEY